MSPARRKFQMPDESDALIDSKDAMLKLTEDLKKAASEITPSQARYFVDSYYQVQQFRIEATGQVRAATAAGEPVALLNWMKAITTRLETTIRGQLDKYTDTIPASRWAKTLVGIGPVIAAGLAAHIDIMKAETAGAIWRFAGLDPTMMWLGAEKSKALVAELWDEEEPLVGLALMAERVNRRADSIEHLARSLNTKGDLTKANLVKTLAKRPWNASLKVLTWKIGESFVKVQNLDGDVYGHVYAERKALEITRNTAGEYAEKAAQILREKNFRDDTIAKQAYLTGRLPDGHIHSRAKRYAVKLFLAHYHHVAYESTRHRQPPKPYIIEHGGHTHFIAPPNWPMIA